MKLAEALILRADYQKRIDQLKQRLLRNAKVQEGDDPAENPAALVEEVARLAQELELLIQRINRTNAATPLQGELTISDAIARRDVCGRYSFREKDPTNSDPLILRIRCQHFDHNCDSSCHNPE